MKIIKKVSLGFIAALILITQPGSVLAVNTTAELELKISALRATHIELASKIQAKEITKEEAQNLWRRDLMQVRAAKEKLFEKRMDHIQAKYMKFAEKKPQRAVLVKERINASLEARAEVKAKRMEVQSNAQAGVISRVQALEIKKNLLQENKAVLQNVHQKINAKREARGYVKLESIKGETRQNARMQVDLTNDELNAKAFIKVKGIEGEALKQNNARTSGAVRNIGFDPVGLKALEAFPDIKADINAAVDTRNNKVQQLINLN